MELSDMAGEFAGIGVAVIGITYDPPAQLKKFTEKHGIGYPLLSDTGSATIRQLGLLNETIPSGTRYFGVPYPGVFLIDPARTIQGKFAEEDYRRRPLMDDLLDAARQMAAGP